MSIKMRFLQTYSTGNYKNKDNYLTLNSNVYLTKQKGMCMCERGKL